MSNVWDSLTVSEWKKIKVIKGHSGQQVVRFQCCIHVLLQIHFFSFQFLFLLLKGATFALCSGPAFFILNINGLLEALISSGKIILEYYLMYITNIFTPTWDFLNTIRYSDSEGRYLILFICEEKKKGLRKTVLATIFLCEKLSPKSKRERESNRHQLCRQ